jgi:hypothetical protein
MPITKKIRDTVGLFHTLLGKLTETKLFCNLFTYKYKKYS